MFDQSLQILTLQTKEQTQTGFVLGGRLDTEIVKIVARFYLC